MAPAARGLTPDPPKPSPTAEEFLLGTGSLEQSWRGKLRDPAGLQSCFLLPRGWFPAALRAGAARRSPRTQLTCPLPLPSGFKH